MHAQFRINEKKSQDVLGFGVEALAASEASARWSTTQLSGQNASPRGLTLAAFCRIIRSALLFIFICDACHFLRENTPASHRCRTSCVLTHCRVALLRHQQLADQFCQASLQQRIILILLRCPIYV